MKHYYLLIFLFGTLSITGQEIEDQGWKNEGKFQLLFNQSAFNKEWSGGGTSSVSGNLTVDYQLNYKNDNFTWDNRILANYGLTKLKGDAFTRKTSDRLELNSIVGKQVPETNYYYSFFTNFRTQFSKGYEYFDIEGSEDQGRRETTHFLSPAYLQFGPGMMWKRSEDLWLNLAPATSRFIFVDKKFTSTPSYQDGSYFGVDQGKSSRYELGASLSGYGKFEVMTNVVMENTLSIYSNYLDKPGNIDIDYLANLEMGINKFLTANLIYQAIYDDNTVGAFQIREVFGVALNYTL